MKNNVLVIAAHSDDEVLGCGGTIAKLVREGHRIVVLFMTDGVSSRGDHNRKKIAKIRKIESERSAEILGISEIIRCDFPDNSMDAVPLLQVVQTIEKAISDFKPSTVFTHYLHDLNVDHSIVARATITATRPLAETLVKRVFGYEVNSSTEWAFGASQFSPNFFVNVSSSLEKKIDAMKAYKSELRTRPHPRSIGGITALASQRGSTSGFEYAEAFEVYRIIED